MPLRNHETSFVNGKDYTVDIGVRGRGAGGGQLPSQILRGSTHPPG